jgi:hypothetical protein
VALDFAKAGQLPTPSETYDREQFRQALRVIEVYFNQLDSNMWNHAERYTARQFVVRGDANGEGGFYGGRFFGDGNYLSKDAQRFMSLVTQNAAAIDVTSIVAFGVAEVANSITLVAPGKMHVSLPGRYLIDYHLGFADSSAVVGQAVNVWLLKNGALVPNSNAQFSTPPNLAVMATASFALDLVAGDFVEIGWAPSDVGIRLVSKLPFAGAPGVAPPIPATPSAVVNMALLGSPIPPDDVLPLPRRLRPP